MLQIYLKPAAETDIPALQEIEESVVGTRIYSPMLSRDEWSEALSAGPVFIIQCGSEIAGNVSYEFPEKDVVYLSGLAIMPAFQGKGIGRKVLKKLLEEFKDVKRIYLVTHPDNCTALHLYQSLGFKVESRIEDYYGDGEPRLMLALGR